MGETVESIIIQIAILFLMMIPGVLLKKCNLISDGFGKGLSNLVLYIAQPALVFMAYVREYDKEILINSLYVFVLSIIVHAIFSVVALGCFRKSPDARQRMLRFATIFSNAAFMGIPLIAAVLDNPQNAASYFPGSTLYASIYNITFNLFLWSLGVYICTNDKDRNNNGVEDHIDELKGGVSPKSGSSLMKAIVHPVTIAALVGLVFFILPIDTVITKDVAFIGDAFTKLANLVAPLSMMVIGLRIADIDLHGIFKDKDMYLFLALRHILLPLATVGIIRLVMLTSLDISPAVYRVVVIMASAPAATSATMFAEKYDCDAAYVSRLVVISTLLSIATMPLMLLLV